MNETGSLWIEYVVVGGYLFFLIAVGFAIRKFSSDDSDYFRAGCKGTWWLVGTSAFMHMFSAWTFTGAAGAAFEAGWSDMVIFAANVLVFFLTFLFLGPWFRQLRAVTGPEIIRLRFGPATQQFYAWMQAFLGLLYAAVWLWGLATFTAAVFDFKPIAEAVGLVSSEGEALEVQLVIIVTGIIVVAYAVTGGSWAVMATDFLQSLILLPMTVLVAFLCLREVGGLSSMLDMIHEQDLTERFSLIKSTETLQEYAEEFPLGKYGLWFALAAIIYKVFVYSTLLTAQRYFGVKDGKEAKKAGLLAAILMAAGMLIWFIPPVVARLTMHDEVMGQEMSKPEEASYAVIALALLPIGMVGLMVVAMLSATMSSMDSGINRNSAIFVRDIVPGICRLFALREPSDRARFVLAQIVSAVFGICIICIALYFAGGDSKGVFEWMLDVGGLVALPMATPLALGFFIRKAPWWAAVASVLVTMVPSTLAFLAESEWMAEQVLKAKISEDLLSHPLTLG
ncbi:MAG: hypothetical protein AAGB34_03625 [Planctomycetota bacterium]